MLRHLHCLAATMRFSGLSRLLAFTALSASLLACSTPPGPTGNAAAKNDNAASTNGLGTGRESSEKIAVSFRNQTGQPVQAELVVTLYTPPGPGPHPLVVINHGRAVDAADRAKLGRARYPAAAHYFTQSGFVVAVPVRLGYGVTGGANVEQMDACSNRQYTPTFDMVAQEIAQVVQALQKRPEVDRERVVVVGVSFGGAATIALGAQPVPGVRALINFAGGGGGNPVKFPGKPCSAEHLEQSWAHYGSRTQLPSLWVYAENDLFWGPELPQRWAQAYNKAGGQARFVRLPPDGDNGHNLFSRSPKKWQPLVGPFLRQLGFAMRD